MEAALLAEERGNGAGPLLPRGVEDGVDVAMDVRELTLEARCVIYVSMSASHGFQ